MAEETLKSLAEKWGNDIYAYHELDVIKADKRAHDYNHFLSLLSYYQNMRANYMPEEVSHAN